MEYSNGGSNKLITEGDKMYLTAMEEQLYLMQKRYLLTICLIRVKLNNSLFGASKPYKSSNEANTLPVVIIPF